MTDIVIIQSQKKWEIVGTVHRDIFYVASSLYCINAEDIDQVTVVNDAAALFAAVCSAANPAASDAYLVLSPSFYGCFPQSGCLRSRCLCCFSWHLYSVVLFTLLNEKLSTSSLSPCLGNYLNITINNRSFKCSQKINNPAILHKSFHFFPIVLVFLLSLLLIMQL